MWKLLIDRSTQKERIEGKKISQLTACPHSVAQHSSKQLLPPVPNYHHRAAGPKEPRQDIAEILPSLPSEGKWEKAAEEHAISFSPKTLLQLFWSSGWNRRYQPP